ncbi:thioredoxin [Aestuariivirga sp.]|uniref:thioredoxin n=1 Tax=Aestuariivirga sp. TaxID=2650926 RepID=UPI0039E43882
MTFMLDAKPQAADLVKDSNDKNFAKDVIEASRTVPVIVDFWAPWCGPCKTLGPAIEKVVKQANGKVKLVKINVDENQQYASQLRVQSIPAVFAFVNGQPVDGFMGALPEGEIKKFIDKLGSQGGLAEEIEAAMTAANAAFAEKDYQTAAEIFVQIIQADREHAGALAGLARCQIEMGDLENARATLALVPPAKAKDPAVLSANAALDLALNPVDTSGAAALEAQLAKNPDDHQARFDLAVLRNGAGDRQHALDHLLHIVKKERGWNEEAARKQLVKLFEAWGPKDDMTLQGRRKLSSLLFS